MRFRKWHRPVSPVTHLHCRAYCNSLPGTLSHISSTEPGVAPETSMYIHLLEACKRQCRRLESHHPFDEMPDRVSEASNIGKIIHGQSLRIGFGSNGLLGSSIIDLYAKCGDVDYTEKAFRQVERRDILSWNSVLSMYSKLQYLEHVLRLFLLIRRDGLLPNEFTFAIVFSACARMANVKFGQQVHCDAVKVGFELNSFCGGSLIDMYAKCGCLFDARRIFNGVVYPDTVSWTAMIAGYAQVHLTEEAVKLFKKMLEVGHVPDQVTFGTVITAYVSSGRLDEAREVFSNMPSRNVVAWNVMISGHAKKGHEAEALKFFQSMRKASIKSTRSTLGSVLSAIAGLGAIDFGLLVHAEAIKQGLDSNVYVGSSLLNLYAKCGNMEAAKKVFYSLDEKNVITWNAMLGGYAQNGHGSEVIELFNKMNESGYQPDEFTYTSILSACACLDNLEAGRQLHCSIIKRKLASNLFVGNALIDMYAKCGAFKEASGQFERLTNRDIVSWNVIIGAYVQEREVDKAFNMFRQMSSSGLVPNEVALAGILNGCAEVQALEQGEQVHCLTVKSGLETSLYSGSSLLDMYVKCGDIRAAYEVFSSMSKHSVASINAIIAGFAKNYLEEAINLLHEMQIMGLNPSPITLVSLLDGCDEPQKVNLGKELHCLTLKSGLWYYEDFLGVSLLGMYMNTRSTRDAYNLFTEFPNPKSTVLWTAMISGYNQNESNLEALEFFREMRTHGILPDQATFSCVLKTSAILSCLRFGSQIHSIIFHTGFHADELTAGCLVDMYAKCGDMSSSSQVFGEMKTKADVISWNSMIVGFAKNGFAENALRVFDDMKQSNVTPDDVTFLGLLTACSHAGKVAEGRSIYNEMVHYYGVRPRVDHYACMVDLFGRWGFLKEAEDFIDKLEFQPDPMIWATLLSSCRLHGDEIRGRRAAERLIESEPKNSAPYVLLSNIYAGSGNWQEVNSLRREMRGKGVKKLPGCSWIYVGEKTNLFVAGDESHPYAGEIYSVLKHLTARLRDDANIEVEYMLYGV